MCKDGKRKHFRVSRLVATIFLNNLYNNPIVLHIDNNKNNNHFTNLKWGTTRENTQQAYDDNCCSNNICVEIFDIISNTFEYFVSVSELCRTYNCSVGYVGYLSKIAQGIHTKQIRGKFKNKIIKQISL